jgi:hypothetical protein
MRRLESHLEYYVARAQSMSYETGLEMKPNRVQHCKVLSSTLGTELKALWVADDKVGNQCHWMLLELPIADTFKSLDSTLVN